MRTTHQKQAKNILYGPSYRCEGSHSMRDVTCFAVCRVMPNFLAPDWEGWVKRVGSQTRLYSLSAECCGSDADTSCYCKEEFSPLLAPTPSYLMRLCDLSYSSLTLYFCVLIVVLHKRSVYVWVYFHASLTSPQRKYRLFIFKRACWAKIVFFYILEAGRGTCYHLIILGNREHRRNLMY